MTKPISVVIPMAGEGRRFKEAGYALPKPFILVNGQPMVSLVLENLKAQNSRYILVARNEHMRNDRDSVDFIKAKYDVAFHAINGITEGTACTVLTCKEFFDNDCPLVIANSDQVVDFNFQAFVDDAISRNLDGSILTFIDREKNPKWSFAKTDNDGYVVEVKEKKPISDRATVGIYYFKRGRDFIKAAERMIKADDRVNGEFYTCPVYNYLIENDSKIGVFDIPFEAMHGLGTPEDLDRFLENFQS